MCEFFLSHFDDFALFVCNNFFNFIDGFLEILISDFEELIFVVKLDFLLFFLISNFLPIVQFIVYFLLKVLSGILEIRFRLDVIEFRYQFLVGFVEAFILEDKLGDFMFESLFGKIWFGFIHGGVQISFSVTSEVDSAAFSFSIAHFH